MTPLVALAGVALIVVALSGLRVAQE